MTSYPPTTPLYGWPLLQSGATNDWRQVDAALLAIEETLSELPTGGGGGGDVDLTGDDSLSVVEGPAGTFTLGVALSADSGNGLEVRGDGLYGGGGGGGGGDVTNPSSVPLVFEGGGVDTGGAIRVQGADTAGVENVLTGPSSPALAPISTATPLETGTTFQSAGTQYLVAVRWYRQSAGQSTPLAMRLWDTTSTATPVWTTTTLTEFGDSAVGWHEQRIPAASRPLLTAGRTYVLSLTIGAGSGGTRNSGAGYIPVPSGGGLTYLNQVTGGAGVYPTTPATNYFFIDGVFAPDAGPADLLDANVYGAGSPAATWTAPALGATERGTRFQVTANTYLCAVRWYRATAGLTAPSTARLWDAAAPSTPVWSTTVLPAFADATVGWREQRLPAGTQYLLTPGLTYVLTVAAVGTSQTQANSYTPVGDTGVTFLAHVAGATGAMPTTTSANANGVDPGLRTNLSLPRPANTGALRLPNGQAGLVAWRDGSDGGDHGMTFDANDRLSVRWNGAERFAVDSAGAHVYPLALTGPTTGTNALALRVAGDAYPRFRIAANGLLEWGPGTTAPDVTLGRSAGASLEANTSLVPTTTQTYDLGNTANLWRNVNASGQFRLWGSGVLEIGSSVASAAGVIRLRNAANGLIGWRNAGNTADLSLTMDASDRLALAVGPATLTTTATAGVATALPAAPLGYVTAVLNGTPVKLPYYAE
jgi:hypothetical protein